MDTAEENLRKQSKNSDVRIVAAINQEAINQEWRSTTVPVPVTGRLFNVSQ
jgi:hypothetical protein